MHTGEIVDVASERRLSAVLEFVHGSGELLIHNGGSKAEEITIVTAVSRPNRSEQRSKFCIDSGTSLPLSIPIPPGAAPHDVSVRIVGRRGELRLALERRPHAVLGSVRSWVTAGLAAACALLVAGGQAPSPAANVVIEPVPAAAEESVVRPRIKIGPIAALPAVTKAAPARPHGEQAMRLVAKAHVSASEADAKQRASAPAVARSLSAPTVGMHQPAERRVADSAVVRDTNPPNRRQPDVAPRVTSLHVPSTAKSGDFIPVSFGAVGQQVKIVASIGPTIVSKTIVGSQHGVVAIRSPRSDLDSRVMTVRAYAQEGNRTAVLQAMVVLVRP